MAKEKIRKLLAVVVEFMRSYVLLRTKIRDFIQIRPTLNPANPPKKGVAKKGYLHQHTWVLIQKKKFPITPKFPPW